jgi:hypothetical protein
LALPQPPSRIADARIFDLHHFGTQPGEGFGAGRSSLELGEINDADSGEKVIFGAVV